MATLPDLGRRRALRSAVGLGVLALARPGWAQSGPKLLESDPELARLAAGILAVDMHSHDGGVHFRRNLDLFIADRMRLGRVAAAGLCHTADGPVLHREPSGKIVATPPASGQLYRHTVERLDFFDALVEGQGLRRILKPGDLRAAHAARAPAIVQAIEGGDFIEGQLQRLAEVHRRGVRHLQLVHFLKNDLGDSQTAEATHGGLTSLGKETIAECNRLGMVVDVAHGSARLVEQAATACAAPLVLSHAPALRQRSAQRSRAVSLDHARLVAQTGGVVGIWTIVGTFKSLPDWADGVARAVEVLGIDHVGIGSDMGGTSKNLFTDYRDFPLLLNALRQRGFSPEEIGKIAGGNYVRVFDRSTTLRG